MDSFHSWRERVAFPELPQLSTVTMIGKIKGFRATGKHKDSDKATIRKIIRGSSFGCPCRG
jgi:hypothetical protein